MIVRFLLAALVAGLFVGVVMTPVQYLGVVPLILQAEEYESGTAGHEAPGADLGGPTERRQVSTLFGGELVLANDHETAVQADDETAGVSPFFGRLLGTLSANIVAGGGFALILAAVSLLTGRAITRSNGVLWGLAGFATVGLAPALGLPPELPAMPAADLFERQVWWAAVVALTAGALYLLVFRRELWATLAAIVMLAVPHVVGAPHIADLTSPVPPTLAAEFAVISLATTAVFWVLLGLGVGLAMDRFGTRAA
ncbi:MAG TPA: cobalt transporter [Aurantimonas coralicida]|uniref:Cobalt transporter n=2 Tax=root TaxID=1 RepID=A0A9C9NCM8_9HYPH|nr:cobalt transporter [Aurantimonas coralicida]HET98903.1 cobalt transporter [Aurantimonas coralicida]